MLWSNLNKVDENGIRPSTEVQREVARLFPALRDEIALANPDVVVFFTGPYLDDLLSLTFPGARIEPLASADVPVSRIAHEALPPRAFRTYHPKYLRMKRKSAAVLLSISR